MKRGRALGGEEGQSTRKEVRRGMGQREESQHDRANRAKEEVRRERGHERSWTG